VVVQRREKREREKRRERKSAARAFPVPEISSRMTAVASAQGLVSDCPIDLLIALARGYFARGERHHHYYYYYYFNAFSTCDPLPAEKLALYLPEPQLLLHYTHVFSLSLLFGAAP